MSENIVSPEGLALLDSYWMDLGQPLICLNSNFSLNFIHFGSIHDFLIEFPNDYVGFVSRRQKNMLKQFKTLSLMQNLDRDKKTDSL